MPLILTFIVEVKFRSHIKLQALYWKGRYHEGPKVFRQVQDSAEWRHQVDDAVNGYVFFQSNIHRELCKYPLNKVEKFAVQSNCFKIVTFTGWNVTVNYVV